MRVRVRGRVRVSIRGSCLALSTVGVPVGRLLGVRRYDWRKLTLQVSEDAASGQVARKCVLTTYSYYLLLATYYLLLTTYYLLLATCYLLLTAYYLLLTTNY